MDEYKLIEEDPADWEDGLFVYLYNTSGVKHRHKVLKCVSKKQTIKTELLRNLTLKYSGIAPAVAHLFYLFTFEQCIIPLGKDLPCAGKNTILDTDSSSKKKIASSLSHNHGTEPCKVILRAIGRPADVLVKLQRTSPEAIYYIYRQLHDDFVHGTLSDKLSEREKFNLENQLWLGMVSMLIHVFNNQDTGTALKEMKKYMSDNLGDYIPAKLLVSLDKENRTKSESKKKVLGKFTDFISKSINGKFRLEPGFKKNIDKFYNEYNEKEGKWTAIKDYIECASDTNTFSVATIDGVLIVKDEGRAGGILVQKMIEKEIVEVLDISDIKSVSIEMVGPKRADLILHIGTEESTIIRKDALQFGSLAAAQEGASLLLAYHQLTCNYHAFDFTTDELVRPPSLKVLRDSSCHGPVYLSWTGDILQKKSRGVKGAFLIQQSSNLWNTFYLIVHLQENNCIQYKIDEESEGYVVKDYHVGDKMKKLTGSYRPSIKDIIRDARLNKNTLNLPVDLQLWVKPTNTQDYPCLEFLRENSIIQPSLNSEEIQESIYSGSRIIHHLDLDLGHILGQGNYSQVHKAQWQGKLVAVKTILPQSDHGSTLIFERYLQMSVLPLSFLHIPSHVPVLPVYGMSLHSPLKVVLGLATGNNLINALQENAQRLYKRHLLQAIEQVTDGLKFLHEHDCCHGNLRCRNIMVIDFSDQRLMVKISDPGLATFYQETHDEEATGPWLAPELVSGSACGNTFAADIYAMAATISEICSFGRCPNSKRMQRAAHCPQEMYDEVVIPCSSLNPDDRPQIQTVVCQVRQISNCVNNDLPVLTSRPADDGQSQPNIIFPFELKVDSNRENRLGKGHFGQVFKGTYHDKPCAIKVLHEASSDYIEARNRKELLSEVTLMASLDHSNVVQIFGVCEAIRQEDEIAPVQLVMELMNGGSLVQRLKHIDPLSDQTTMFCEWGKQILQGLSYLHTAGIVHRDLACRNLLLSNSEETGERVKISDFGLARLLSEDKDYYRIAAGSPHPVPWWSPEALYYSRFGKPGDIWSFGVVLWEMFSFGISPNKEPLYMESRQTENRLLQGQRLRKPASCPQGLYDSVMIACWQWDPVSRPNVDSLTDLLQREISMVENESTL